MTDLLCHRSFFNNCKDNKLIVLSVQYDDGLLPDIILLTQCYYHRETRLDAMKRFCLCSPRCHVKQHFGEIKNKVFFKERGLLSLKGPVG